MSQHPRYRLRHAVFVAAVEFTSLCVPPTTAAASARLLPAACDAALQQSGDPAELQRAQRRAFLTSPVQSSGFWAPRDAALTLQVTFCGPPPDKAPEVWIESGAGDPAVTRQRHVLRSGLNTVAIKHGGVVYFVARGGSGEGRIAVRLIGGGRPIARFVLGQDRSADWAAILNRASAEPYAELVGQRTIVTMPLAPIRDHVSDPEPVLKLWDRIVSLAEEQYGLAYGNVYPAVATPFRHHVVTVPDSSAPGAPPMDFWLGIRASDAHAALNADELMRNGWASWSQLGSHYRIPAMSWNRQQDAASLLTPLYVQRALGQPSKLVAERVWDRVRAHLDRGGNDYDSMDDPLVRAAMLWQLDLAFGRDFHARLAQRYRTLASADLPVSDAQKRRTFIVEASRVAGRDLSPFFDRWRLRADAQVRSAIDALRLPALDKPIWENRDDAVLHTYALDEQGLAGRIVMRKAVIAGRSFTVAAEVGNANGRPLQYRWDIPAGFAVSGVSGASAVLTAPLDALPGAFAPIRVTVTDGRVATTLGASIQIIGDGGQLYDAMMASAFGNGVLRQWSASRRGTPGDLYVYANPYRATRDYFRLVAAEYGYFPIDATSNASWRYLGSYNGEFYSPSRAFDLTVLAKQRKAEMREWSDAQAGTIGDVYAYENRYRNSRDYFRLLKARYGYFPTNWTSNADWQYLGSYDGSQYRQ
ncbi:M60 family metallopeptidase [Burkholderia stabilis]|uniref:M60 family metallopeptidase n=1 Tax=Burkholderia stabilis TaxID=95485 RepID=UPI00080BE17F|nr:M60 family metallopeptidase [Burkholderia stabilis]GAU03438.1 wall-associated protein [Burkholderia stabilis]